VPVKLEEDATAPGADLLENQSFPELVKSILTISENMKEQLKIKDGGDSEDGEGAGTGDRATTQGPSPHSSAPSRDDKKPWGTKLEPLPERGLSARTGR
jgi:hypothetical protein